MRKKVFFVFTVAVLLTMCNTYDFYELDCRSIATTDYIAKEDYIDMILATDTDDTISGFDISIPFVLKHEGEAFVRDTTINEVSRRGVTLSTYRQYYGRGNVSSIKNITVAEATAIYKHLFWDANNLDSIDQSGFKKTSIVLMDSGINIGPSRANKFLQGILGAGKTGRIDEQTLAHLRVTELTDDELHTKLVKKRRDYYSRLVQRKNVFAKYHKGWNNRLDDISEFVKEI